MVGSTAPNVKVIPITNPSRHSDLYTGKNSALSSNPIIIYPGTSVFPSVKNVESDIPNMNAAANPYHGLKGSVELFDIFFSLLNNRRRMRYNSSQVSKGRTRPPHQLEIAGRSLWPKYGDSLRHHGNGSSIAKAIWQRLQ